MHEYILYSYFWVWVISLWIVFLFSFIFKQNSRCYCFFFSLSSTLISRSVTISLSILPLTGCIQVFAITNNTVIYRVEQMLLLDDWASLGYLLKSGIAGSVYTEFSEIHPLCFPKLLHNFANPPVRNECFPYSTYSPVKAITGVFNLVILTGVRWYLKVVLVCIYWEWRKLIMSLRIFWPFKFLLLRILCSVEYSLFYIWLLEF